MTEAVISHITIGTRPWVVGIVGLPKRVRTRLDHPAPVLFDQVYTLIITPDQHKGFAHIVPQVWRKWLDRGWVVDRGKEGFACDRARERL
jgi:hypothetical protein